MDERYLVEKTEEKPGNIMIKYPVAETGNIMEKNSKQLPFLSNSVNIEDSAEGKIINIDTWNLVDITIISYDVKI